jgi:aldose 1-epimerase
LFGQIAGGRSASLYTLSNSSGMTVKVTDYGTIITELWVPDRAGKPGDVVLGFDKLDGYLVRHPYFGCTVGRFANRIAKGRFTLGGKEYKLAQNDGQNHLHGGLNGFDKALWRAESESGASIKFTYISPDGEEGYPGALDVAVTMTITEANELIIAYSATTNQPTPVNLTNHSYFNLAGGGTVLDHELELLADAYTVNDATSIPTGEIRPVAGTLLDFTRPTRIGAHLFELTNQPVGYDNNFVIRNGGRSLTTAARVYEPTTGRVMEVQTTQPGVQLYTANYLDGSLTGKRGVVYNQHSAFCLETQHYPDSVNQPGFPSTILQPGQQYRQTALYKFSVR